MRLVCLDVVEREVMDTTEQISCEGEEKQYYFPYFITREKPQMN